jgi:hypothetical protein
MLPVFPQNSLLQFVLSVQAFKNFLRFSAQAKFIPKRGKLMKIKLLFLTVLMVFAMTLSGCSKCGSGPGDNSNSNANVPTPTPEPTPTATPTPAPTPTPSPTPPVVTGIPECDDLFAKFEVWAAEKNKNGSKAEKTAVALMRLSLILPIKSKLDKMKPNDREKIAAQCSLASIQFERKQRSLETAPNVVK